MPGFAGSMLAADLLETLFGTLTLDHSEQVSSINVPLVVRLENPAWRVEMIKA